MEKPYQSPAMLALQEKYKEYFKDGDISRHVGLSYSLENGKPHITYEVLSADLPRHVVDEILSVYQKEIQDLFQGNI